MTSFAAVAKANAQCLPERSEQMLIGDNRPAHHHDRGDGLVDELLQVDSGTPRVSARMRAARRNSAHRAWSAAAASSGEEAASPGCASGRFQAAERERSPEVSDRCVEASHQALIRAGPRATLDHPHGLGREKRRGPRNRQFGSPSGTRPGLQKDTHLQALQVMARPGLEPGTPRFSVVCSTN